MPPPHFSIRVVQQIEKSIGIKFVVTTDVPCHLFLRWTLEKPRTHKDPILRRGVYFPERVRFCFVEYEDNEQVEAGDTLTHTFLKYDWPSCQTRYFYFWGTVAGEVSPSESPLFVKHFIAMPIEDIFAGCFRIVASGDDCQRGLYNGADYFGLTYGYDAAGNWGTRYKNLGCGLRYTNVTIPPGSTILKAYLRFFAYNGQGAQEIKTYIRGQDSHNPAIFTNLWDYDNRPRTTEKIDWSPIETWMVGNYYDSPDISPILQAIIDLPLWASGYHLVIFWDDHDGRTSVGGANSRFAQSWDSACALCPVLCVMWEKP